MFSQKCLKYLQNKFQGQLYKIVIKFYHNRYGRLFCRILKQFIEKLNIISSQLLQHKINYFNNNFDQQKNGIKSVNIYQ